MKTKLLLGILFLAIIPTAESYASDLELLLIYPNREKKVFSVPIHEWKIPLRKSKWVCVIKKATPDSSQRAIDCENEKGSILLFTRCDFLQDFALYAVEGGYHSLEFKCVN